MSAPYIIQGFIMVQAFCSYCQIRKIVKGQAKTPVTPGRCPHGDPTASLKNAERRGARSTNASITAATQWHHHWTRWDCIERRATVRTLSILKTNTVARCSLGVLIERRGDTVRSPKPHSKVSYNATGAPLSRIARTGVTVQTPYKRIGRS